MDRLFIVLFDPPHLLKNLRRNLMKYDLQTSKGFVSFKYIRDFHEVDKTLLIRCAPKMTDAHLNTMGLNSMKVALAAQVFSHTVAAGMNLCILSGLIEASAAPTVEFILKIDNLFDSMNGTRKNPLRGKQLHCAVKEGSAHINFWKEMIAYVESWVFLQPLAQNQDGPRKHASGPRSRIGWLQTLRAILKLSEEMLHEREYFMTKRCNQDCLENFFSRIRGSGGNRTNPSAYEFSSLFKIACVNSFRNTNKFSNCEPDGDKFMFFILSAVPSTTIEENEVQKEEVKEGQITSNDDFDDSLVIDFDSPCQDACFERLDNLSQNVVAYLSGYLSRKVLYSLNLNECDICSISLTDRTKPMLQHTLFLYLKEYKNQDITEGGLTHPSESMTKCIAELLQKANNFFSHHLPICNILQNLKNVLSQLPVFQFLCCELHSNDVKKKIVSFASAFFF
ncbi:uncharacterized protein LOC118205225 [Stegodyphus dumicola]|uniref:uncharacterized protein LOC118205225 n=1 Tax=Stegodyphus dumicola TaxID=202533 RepID=UPI0015A83149|nr:uncharacterized protein LOC118205225 [Stegodyphus dumicola]